MSSPTIFISAGEASGEHYGTLLIEALRRKAAGMELRFIGMGGERMEAAGAVLGPRLKRIGFYSYGEITPHATSGTCELHNQTMTITTMVER